MKWVAVPISSRPGENGEVFKAGDVDGLRHALTSVLGDAKKTRTMGSKSIEIINRWGFREDIAGLRQALAAVTGSA